MLTFGERLKAAMRRQEWTQAETAEFSGIPQTDISSYTRGRLPRLDKVEQLADALDVSAAWLAWGRGAPDDATPSPQSPPSTPNSR